MRVLSVFAALVLVLAACDPRRGEVFVGEPAMPERVPDDWRASYVQAMKFNRVVFEMCYERALERAPDRAGRLDVEITLGTPAVVRVISNDTGDDALARCVAELVPDKIYLPTAPSGRLVFPLDFRRR